MSRGFRVVVTVLALVGVGMTAGFLHLRNAQLRRRLERQPPTERHASRLREENTRLSALVGEQARGAQDMAATLRRQVAEVRAEIEGREKAAAVQRAGADAQAMRDAATLATNRDPMTGLTKLEHFRDLGQGTPVAAFQTMVRAALNGDEAALAKLFTMPAATRTLAEALIHRLPPEAQAQWTPEKLAMLWVTGALTELPALQITGHHFESADLAVVTFRAPQFQRDEKVNLKLTRDGWKVIAGTGMIRNLEKKLGAGAPPAGANEAPWR